MSTTPNITQREHWQDTFIAWCNAQSELASRGGARLLARELKAWSARCKAGDVDEDLCSAFLNFVSERKLYHLDRGILAKLVVQARAAVRGISDVSARFLGCGPKCPEAGAELIAHRNAITTNRQYLRDYIRYLYAGQMPTSGTNSLQTIRTRAAAIRVMLRRKILAATSTLRHRRHLDQEVVDWAADTLVDGLARFKQLERVLANGPTKAVGSPGTSPVPLANGRGARRRRRQGLGRYGEDAEDRVFDAIQDLIDACAVVIVAGARPVEVAREVKIRRYRDLLLLWVPGGKLTDSNGQPLRCIWFRPENKAAKHLHQLAAKAGGTVRIAARSAKAICDTMARAGRNVYPRHRHTPTAYSFRHEMITELRTAGDARITAQVAGHASASTQQGYGTRRRTTRGGRNPIVRVRATRPVRALNRVRPRPQLGSPGTRKRKPRR